MVVKFFVNNCNYIIAKHPADNFNEKKCCNFNHYHCGIHTSSDNVYETIAKWFGVATHSVQSIKSKFDTTYALYLIHYNACYEDGTPKPKIPYTDVVSNFDLNYEKLIGHIQNSNAKDDILTKIATGDIRQYKFDTELTYAFRIKYANQIKNALAIWNENKMKGERDMAKSVMWIYGSAGMGKTELAKFLSRAKYGDGEFYMSDSGEHPFDNYADQPCLILDDVGSDNLNAKVVLKLFDPYNKCFTKARYFNRAINADLIIVTSSMSPETFWKSCRDNFGVNGSWEQLTRRLTGGVYHITSKEEMNATFYDNEGKNPTTAIVKIPVDVQKRTVTVTAEMRMNDMLGAFNFEVKALDKDNFTFNGEFHQSTIDELPFADKPEQGAQNKSARTDGGE